jgi:hypothetical protein
MHTLELSHKRLHVVVYIYTIPFNGCDTVTIEVQKSLEQFITLQMWK